MPRILLFLTLSLFLATPALADDHYVSHRLSTELLSDSMEGRLPVKKTKRGWRVTGRPAGGSALAVLALEEGDVIAVKAVDRTAQTITVGITRGSNRIERVYHFDAAAPAPTPPPLEPVVGVVKKGPNHYVVKRSAVSGPGFDAAGQARLVPNMKDGKAYGIKLFAIKPGSWFAVLGFENGDTVHTINGYDISSPDRALEVYSKLRTATSLTVDLERRGKPVTLTIELQD